MNNTIEQPEIEQNFSKETKSLESIRVICEKIAKSIQATCTDIILQSETNLRVNIESSSISAVEQIRESLAKMLPEYTLWISWHHKEEISPLENIKFLDISHFITGRISTLEDTNPCPAQSCKRCDLVFGDCEKISS